MNDDEILTNFVERNDPETMRSTIDRLQAELASMAATYKKASDDWEILSAKTVRERDKAIARAERAEKELIVKSEEVTRVCSELAKVCDQRDGKDARVGELEAELRAANGRAKDFEEAVDGWIGDFAEMKTRAEKAEAELAAKDARIAELETRCFELERRLTGRHRELTKEEAEESVRREREALLERARPHWAPEDGFINDYD